jgi:hypothetical protein
MGKASCKKPVIKCSECDHQKYITVTDKVIFDHLAGKHTIGVYPLLEDEHVGSGNGGHIWIFFGQAIQASLARRLGAFLLTRAMDKRNYKPEKI